MEWEPIKGGREGGEKETWLHPSRQDSGNTNPTTLLATVVFAGGSKLLKTEPEEAQ